ncbi:hypothetical protein HanXRQr2_Chr16g0730881 [Helianthus annuus]|uniref:Uncharacterized protein n=1 Tax=Helianthus annuus TaxID=4232 RepID=A0A9K3DPW3_HELAN|nr:hypothetical protein HanXRQr2_Chr16g0730881 [Helianthus annuus]KAJ0958296.1 hypothetical protein HanPSC8_Chr01g0037351 [Helianthus annuus]
MDPPALAPSAIYRPTTTPTSRMSTQRESGQPFHSLCHTSDKTHHQTAAKAT